MNVGVLALASGLAAQVLKVLIELLVRRRWRPRLLVRNGGMPSSHTATVTTLAVLVGQDAGSHSPVFSLVLVFAFYVVLEATGLRQEVGHQARLVNHLVAEMRRTHQLHAQDLREFVGHTWGEVLGGVLCGVVFALLVPR